MRDFHKHVRVVYRAMRKLYGMEKVQDECLRVFKVVFPILYRAKNGSDDGFTDDAKKRLTEIFASWNAEPLSTLDTLICKVQNDIYLEFKGDELIKFCEDILPVVMRIRKLTPRECYRLQGVSDKDIDTLLSSGISKSSHYKLAGNSITAGGNYQNKDGQWDGPLFNIFRKLLIETDPDMAKGEAFQLSLF